MPDNSSLGLSKSEMETMPFSSPIWQRKDCALARYNRDSDPRKMLFPVIVGGEAFKYPVFPARLLGR